MLFLAYPHLGGNAQLLESALCVLTTCVSWAQPRVKGRFIKTVECIKSSGDTASTDAESPPIGEQSDAKTEAPKQQPPTPAAVDAASPSPPSTAVDSSQ